MTFKTKFRIRDMINFENAKCEITTVLIHVAYDKKLILYNLAREDGRTETVSEDELLKHNNR